jgi:arylsulfatase A-like enzyme
MRLFFLFCLLLSLGSQSQQRPNVIYIMSDDHDNDAISAYSRKYIQTPHIDRLAREGMKFRKAFVGNSICAPSRATMLTGQHSHKNGVKDNRTPFDTAKNHVAHLFQQAGYQTALVGKWHLHSLPMGFDYWRILPGMGQYFDTRMITMNRDTIITRGYSADVITDEAISWMDMRAKNKPFLLLLNHKAPHRNFVPALKHLQTFSSREYAEPPTLYIDTAGRGSAWRTQTMSILHDMRLSADLKIDPKYLEGIPELKPAEDDIATYNGIMRRMPKEQLAAFESIYAERGKIIRDKRPTGKELLKYKYQWYMQDYLACIASIDEGVGRILDYLDKSKIANNTVVVYTSDQGFYLGENGWFDKRFAYDVSMQTPLLIRWPAVIKKGMTSDALVQNIDFAPTLLDLIGAKIPKTMQGMSLKPILTGQTKKLSRKYLYYHYYEFVKDHTVIPHRAVRSDRYKLIHFYTVDEWELYDLAKDPGELNNLVSKVEYFSALQEMKKALRSVRLLYQDLN